MEFNNKKLERTSRLINYSIAIILCGFLIALSGKILGDIDDWKEAPKVDQFENKELIAQKDEEISKVQKELNPLLAERQQLENTLEIAKNDYQNAKNSFDNWLAARKTVGSKNEDKEVLARAKGLDEYFKIEKDRETELEAVKAEIAVLNEKANELRMEVNRERDRAFKARNAEMRSYELKVFLIRLLFILPILLLGIYFAVKKRKHKYWPLFLGFILFSIYAFFFGLMPYLPSYGGYVRYTVGIILVTIGGAYVINKIRAFVERKKEELKVSTAERSKSVQTETAEKALENHMCPSCGKDFIVKSWDKSVRKKEKNAHFSYVTNFCRFCGLELFKKCENCETMNFAHLPFCSNCGVGTGKANG